jgi:hypothetical protein
MVMLAVSRSVMRNGEAVKAANHGGCYAQCRRGFKRGVPGDLRASKWVWLSMMPGISARPVPLMIRRAFSGNLGLLCLSPLFYLR